MDGMGSQDIDAVSHDSRGIRKQLVILVISKASRGGTETHHIPKPIFPEGLNTRVNHCTLREAQTSGQLFPQVSPDTER